MFTFSASVDSGATQVSLLRGTTCQDPLVLACAFNQQNAFRLTEERLFSRLLPEMREEQVQLKTPLFPLLPFRETTFDSVTPGKLTGRDKK